MVKNLPAIHETWVQSLGWKMPWRREWLPTPVFLPGEFHGQRSLIVRGVAKNQTRRVRKRNAFPADGSCLTETFR